MTRSRSPRCCCACAYFIDAFTRSGDGLDADGVNLPGKTRYVFEPGDWLVTGGKLEAQVGESEIVFYSGAARKFDVYVDVTLTSIGDYGTLRYGSSTVRVERLDADTVRYTSTTSVETVSQEIAGGAGTYELHAIFFPRVRYPLWWRDTEAQDLEDLVDYASSCQYGRVESGGFTEYAFVAAGGVTFDNLVVNRSKIDCQDEPTFTCDEICWRKPPAYLDVDISGFLDSFFPCSDTDADWANCLNEAFFQWFACNGACDDDPACECLCKQARIEAECACAAAFRRCALYGPCAALNGMIRFYRNNGPCDGTCTYGATVDWADVYRAFAFDDCDQVISGSFVLTARHEVSYFDADEGDVVTEIVVGLPLTATTDNEAGATSGSATPNSWTTGLVPASEFCSGETFLLRTTNGDPVYADEVAVSVQTPLLRSCGKVSKIECGEEQVGDCETEVTVVEECDHATHTEVELQAAAGGFPA